LTYYTPDEVDEVRNEDEPTLRERLVDGATKSLTKARKEAASAKPK
jgi:hypothetical protein